MPDLEWNRECRSNSLVTDPGTLVGTSSPEVPLTKSSRSSNFLIEQFWGRAARAFSDSKESGRPFFFRNFPFPPKPTQFQYVEIVKFTVIRASVSTGTPA
jgi:hypothetical protein